MFAYGWLVFGHFYSWPYLIIFLYSSFIIPAVFLLLGTLLTTFVDSISGRDFITVVLVAIVALAAPWRAPFSALAGRQTVVTVTTTRGLRSRRLDRRSGGGSRRRSGGRCCGSGAVAPAAVVVCGRDADESGRRYEDCH